jgi:uncharacterized repeat protein (TIGR04138 family)
MDEILALQNIIRKDPRYPVEAYLFVIEALYYTRKKLCLTGHVSGQQLLEGIRELTLEHYGCLAKTVLEHWGINETIDFGNIVFNMVNEKVLGKTEQDKLDDFRDGYNFDEVFVKNYQFDIKGLKKTKR